MPIYIILVIISKLYFYLTSEISTGIHVLYTLGVISGSLMQPTFVALGTYMVLGVFRTILSTVVFWLS
jgi:hypothetical protein